MKIREIILDFTSLLDIVMIILFFFVLFSSFEAEEVTLAAQQAKSSYEQLIAENEAAQKAWQEQADAQWDKLLATDKNAALNQQALDGFDEGNALLLRLCDVHRSDDWRLEVSCAGAPLADIHSTEPLDELLLSALEGASLLDGRVVIGTLLYDGSALGSAGAVPAVERAVQQLQKEHPNIYFNSINISE